MSSTPDRARVGSTPSMTFSATVNTGTSMKCWWTMPMPAAMASPGRWNGRAAPSMRISPSSGRVEAVEDVHQGRLAGAVLAEQREDLAGLHVEIDAVVGDDTGEALGDAPQLELHGVRLLGVPNGRRLTRRRPFAITRGGSLASRRSRVDRTSSRRQRRR